jgi:hypothetical protein
VTRIRSLGFAKGWSIAFLGLCAVAGTQAHAAEIQLLSDDRHVSASVFAGAHEGSQSFSESHIASQYSDFHPNINLLAAWGDTKPGIPGDPPTTAVALSKATQDSIVSTTHLSFDSLIDAETGSNGGPFATTTADALSYFKVSFSVSIPTAFTLSLTDERGYITAEGTYEKMFDLTSLSGSVLELPIVDTNSFKQYVGVLLPGETYTLLVSQHAFAEIPDPLGAQVTNRLQADMTFADVPEPSTYLILLLGLGIFGMARGKVPVFARCTKRMPRR